MEKIEYPAMIYKSNRNRVCVANCIIKNIVGFGKTEQDAINNLKESLQHSIKDCEISILPVYGFSIAQ
jgi:predicted RNase H-like HicB family nuclease